jgi:hypothetical protein
MSLSSNQLDVISNSKPLSQSNVHLGGKNGIRSRNFNTLIVRNRIVF